MNKLLRFFLLLPGLFIFSPVTHAFFSDVSSDHPYFTAINYLQENAIVQGYEDGSFRPGQTVNRAETLKIILLGSKVLVPEIAEQDIFPDVLYGSWYAKFAAKAKNLGIVQGDGDTGMFRPGDTVNLAEILKILLNTNNVVTSEPETRPYADIPTDAWFAPYFAYASSISLLPQGPGDNVQPATPVTRGLMAQLMYQLAMKPEGYQEGEASYYGAQFHGKNTASGQVFDASLFTAAHRTLPFDSWIRVRNLENGKEVYVRVNDRGPYAGENRIVDLSQAAFESISPLSRGVINVSITPVNGPPSQSSSPQAAPFAECPEADQLKYVSKTIFENITLEKDFPDTFVASEVLTLQGTSASNLEQVSAFVVNADGDQFPYYADIDDSGHFDLTIFFPKPGLYQMGLLPGASGSSVVQDITILAENCLNEGVDAGKGLLTDLSLSIENGNTNLKWTDTKNYELSKIVFSQGSKEKVYIVFGKDSLTPNYPDFEDWSKGNTTVSIQGADLDAGSILEPGKLVWGPKTTKTFQAETHYEYDIVKASASVISMPSTLSPNTTLTVKIDPKTNIQENGKVILPSGLVQDVPLESPTHSPILGPSGNQVYPATVADLRLIFTPTVKGVHFVEINDEQSLAAINVPVYPTDVYPLIPNPVELSFNDHYELSNNITALQNEMLDLVNADRATHGLPPLKLDLTLSQLAQSRSDDMVTNKYFGHWNKDGDTANDLRSNFAINQYVSENLARDASPVLAQYGLMRSASHRGNILNNEWKQAGFGFSTDPGNGIIFVQIFSDFPIDFANLDTLRNSVKNAIDDQRGSEFNLSNQLNDLAQAWSQRMADESFFGFTAPDNTSLVDIVRDAGVSKTLGTYIVGNSSFVSGTTQITDNDQIKESHWKELGIGIVQDSLGIINFTLLYTE